MTLFKGVSVERVLLAAPAAIFAVLADPSRHPSFDGSGTVRAAVEGSRQLGLGDRFGMDMKAGLSYRMVNEVVEFEPDRRIAWQARSVHDVLRPVLGGRIWRYELEPAGGGTRVRQTWDISQEALPLLVVALRAPNRLNMTRSLQKLAAVVS